MEGLTFGPRKGPDSFGSGLSVSQQCFTIQPPPPSVNYAFGTAEARYSFGPAAGWNTNVVFDDSAWAVGIMPLQRGSWTDPHGHLGHNVVTDGWWYWRIVLPPATGITVGYSQNNYFDMGATGPGGSVSTSSSTGSGTSGGMGVPNQSGDWLLWGDQQIGNGAPSGGICVSITGTDTTPPPVYELIRLPIANSEHVYLNGVYQQEGVDWSRSGLEIVPLAPMDARPGDTMCVEYLYEALVL